MNFTLNIAIGIDRNQNTVFNLRNPYITGTKAGDFGTEIRGLAECFHERC